MSLRRKVRPILLFSIGILVITKIVFLSPSHLEENKPSTTIVDRSQFIQDDTTPNLAPGIPKGRIPDYSIEGFDYVSVQGGIKQWKILAERTLMYSAERLVHSKRVRATLFDPDGNITTVSGLEAKYFLHERDLEIFGNVRTILPDGFELRSEYLRYLPRERLILIPQKYPTHGKGTETEGQILEFWSNGLNYSMKNALVTLHRNVKVVLEKKAAPGTAGVPDKTTIESDHCVIYRNDRLAKFTIQPNSPDRFVHITQPNLIARGRRANLKYGDFSQVLNYLTAFDDVLIKELNPAVESNTEKKPLRYSTCGQADFDTHDNVIVLTQYPQVYQDQDTVTGEKILLHRDSGIVEIEQSNAFSQGT